MSQSEVREKAFALIFSKAMAGESTTIISLGDKYISSSKTIDEMFELNFSGSPNYIPCTYKPNEDRPDQDY